MKYLYKFLKSQRYAFFWIHKNKLIFSLPIFIGVILDFFASCINWDNEIMLFISYIKINLVLFIASYYLISYTDLRIKKIMLLKILLCSILNFVLSEIILIPYLMFSIDLGILLLLLYNLNYTIIIITLIIIINGKFRIYYYFNMKNFIGVIILFFILFLIQFSISELLETNIRYYFNTNILNKLKKLLEFLLINLYSFSLIVFIQEE